MSDPINVQNYGAVGDGVTDNTAAFNAWWAALMASNSAGYIPGGNYVINSSLVWDFATRAQTGVKIYGDGCGATILKFPSTTGTALQMQVGGGPSTIFGTGAFRVSIKDIAFQSYSGGDAFKIGQDSCYDTFQASSFENLSFQKFFVGTSQVCLRLNAILGTAFINVASAGDAATTTYLGSGTSCQMTMVGFSSFMNCSFGNANIGLNFSTNGNSSLGFIGDNTFISIDQENTTHSILGSGPSTPYHNNIFINGRFDNVNSSGYVISSQGGFSLGPGGSIVFDNCDFGNSALYGSGTQKVLDPANYKGVLLRGAYIGTIATPAFPASGSTYVNSTGQKQSIYIFGGYMTAPTVINGIGVELSAQATITLQPQETICFYYSALPQWVFMPQV